jgi:hypothetical protein
MPLEHDCEHARGGQWWYRRLKDLTEHGVWKLSRRSCSATDRRILRKRLFQNINTVSPLPR